MHYLNFWHDFVVCGLLLDVQSLINRCYWQQWDARIGITRSGLLPLMELRLSGNTMLLSTCQFTICVDLLSQ